MNACPRPAEMSAVLGAGEDVLWEGIPHKSAYIVRKLFFGSFLFLPILALCALIAIVNFVEIFRTGNSGSMFVAPVFSLPLVLWVRNIFTLPRRWANEYYLATNQRIIIRTGYKSKFYTVFNYSDIRSTELRASATNRMFKVGDIHFDCGLNRVAYSESVTAVARKEANNTEVFCAVPVPEAYMKMQKIVYDSKTGSSYQQLPQLSPQPVFEYPQPVEPEPQPGASSESARRIVDI
jgi:hypothetical protein